METSYYYFIASLPALYFDAAPPMSSEEFLADSAAWISPNEYAVLRALAAGLPGCDMHLAGRQWLAWDNGFRNAITVARATRLNRDPQQYQRGTGVADAYTRAAVQELIKGDDPLGTERGIDRQRWKYLDELSATHQFDFHVIFSYFLKLRILERWAALDTDQGEKMLNKSLTVSDKHGTA
jgi:hypothetical protein